MPELPEVETVRRIIEPQIRDRTIEIVKIFNEEIIAYPSSEQIISSLTKQTMAGMSRRGKFLTIHFESGDRLVLHLRMTGQLLISPKDDAVEKHTHLALELSDSNELRYIDVRRFGRFWLLGKDEKDAVTGQTKLGLEPMDPALNAEYLKSKLGKSKKPIKEMLLDQTVVAGIGNIYSDEILFASNMYPNTHCSDLTDTELARLAKKIPKIILWAIEKNEITPEEYLQGKGKEYRNTPYLHIYGRSGQPCMYCGTTIEKITVGGRSSCYCPRCQMKKCF